MARMKSRTYTQEDFVKILPEFEGPFCEVVERMTQKGIERTCVIAIRHILGYSNGKRKSFSQDEIDEIKSLYDSGLTFKEISKKTGRDATVLYSMLKRKGMTDDRLKRFSKIEDMRIKDMCDKGFTLGQIAMRLQRREGTIAYRIKILKRNGMQINYIERKDRVKK